MSCVSNLPPQSAELCLVRLMYGWVFQTLAEMHRSETPRDCALQTVPRKTCQTPRVGLSMKTVAWKRSSIKQAPTKTFHDSRSLFTVKYSKTALQRIINEIVSEKQIPLKGNDFFLNGHFYLYVFSRCILNQVEIHLFFSFTL